jgi:hypothetical protein
MMSVVCVYNDRRILEDNLLKGIQNQIANYELILVDNTTDLFPSAATALNYGSRKATSKYIMFVHQDVYLPSANWLDQAESYLNSIHDLGIAGVAGMVDIGSTNEDKGRNIIKHGNPLEIWAWGHPITEPEQVQTLDECLIIVPKNIFDWNCFDEETCDGWDLYAVDYCLNIRQKGLTAYVLPLMIHHRSKGHISAEYFVVLQKILNKHRNQCRRINTSVDSWSTCCPLGVQKTIKIMNKKARRAIAKASSLIKG